MVKGVRVHENETRGYTAGFALDTLLEPQPTKDFKKDEAQAHHYDELMREPGFLCVRARKA